MSIERLNPRNAADVNAVAELHERYLADSPVAKMGRRFIREFYYGRLVEDGLIDCVICRVDGHVVGFMAYTGSAYDFLSRGVRHHFLALSWVMLKSLVAR